MRKTMTINTNSNMKRRMSTMAKATMEDACKIHDDATMVKHANLQIAVCGALAIRKERFRASPLDSRNAVVFGIRQEEFADYDDLAAQRSLSWNEWMRKFISVSARRTERERLHRRTMAQRLWRTGLHARLSCGRMRFRPRNNNANPRIRTNGQTSRKALL